MLPVALLYQSYERGKVMLKKQCSTLLLILFFMMQCVVSPVLAFDDTMEPDDLLSSFDMVSDEFVLGSVPPSPTFERYIIKYKKSQPMSESQFLDLDSDINHGLDRIEIVELDVPMDVETFQSQLTFSDGIEYIQPDYELVLSNVEATDELKQSDETGIEDTELPHALEQPVQKEVPSPPNDVIVALIDSGVDMKHPALADKFWVNADEITDSGIDDDENGYIDDVIGWNFVDNTNVIDEVDPSLELAHGTHLAGIIGGASDNIKIMPLKAFSGGTAYTSDLIKAINYAQANGADIINCSWGCEQENIALKEAMNAADDVLFVCAAGNQKCNIDEQPIYPAAYGLPNTITVTSVNADDGLSYFSNYGEKVDIAALGRNVQSTLPGGQYGQNTGTSMAAAFVSYGAAEVLASNLELTPIAIKERLVNSADKLSTLQGYVKEAARLNVNDAIADLHKTVIVPIDAKDDFTVDGYSDTRENWQLFCSNDNLAVETCANVTFVLKADGSVWSWGNNSNGLLGNGTYTNSNIPMKINGLSNITCISANNNACMARKSDGSVWWWGVNGTNTAPVPTQVTGLTATDISTGYDHFMVLDANNNVWTWGSNIDGQLGCSGSSLVPTCVGISNIVQISAGYHFSMALNTSGQLSVWGLNNYGQLGTGDITNYTTPQQTSAIFQKISAGFYHSAGIRNGQLYTWGKHTEGALGLGTSNGNIEIVGTDRIVKTPTATSLLDMKDVSSGYNYTLVLKNEGQVYSSGDGSYGKLGNNQTENIMNFTLISSMTSIDKISAGYQHSAACGEDGKTYTWGYNNYGQLGDGSTMQREVPVRVSKLSNIQKIDSGYSHNLALDNSGKLWSWGYNNRGQVGIGSADNQSIPVKLGISASIIDADAGFYHSVACDSLGNVWTWGYNDKGQLGNGTMTNGLSPTKLMDINNVIEVVAGGSHTLALKSDGTVWSWGYNNKGQLGDGTAINHTTPAQINGLSGIVAIAAGYYHSLAVKNDGSVWAWGYNNHGQLGIGNLTDANTPQMIPTSQLKLFNTYDTQMPAKFKISAGYYHSSAMTETGMAYTWGYNNYGQLGIGSTAQSSQPIQVGGITFNDLSSNQNFSLGVSTGKEVYGWGYNNHAQLGDSTTINQTSPLKMTLISNVEKVSNGYAHSLALKTDGSVWSWGYNDVGQLGDGRSTYMAKPYLISGEINDIYGNDLENAHQIDDNVTINSKLDYDYDEDCFVFTTSKTATYQIFTESSMDMYGYLYNASKTQIAYNDDGTDFEGNPTMDFRLEVNLVAGNTYYLKIGNNAGEAGGYLLYLFPDDFPGVLMSARVENHINTFHVAGNISHRKDVDVFAFTPPSVGTYIMTSVGDTEVTGIVYDTSKQELLTEQTRDGAVSFRITTAQLQTGQKYYIVIHPKTLTSTGDYDLCIETPFQLISIS